MIWPIPAKKYLDSPWSPEDPLVAELPDTNPYATPVTVADASLVHATTARSPWLRRIIGLQAIVIVASLAVEAYEHESIVGSGPVFALVGLVIAILAFRDRDRAAIVFGVSAILFASLIVFLINYNSWSPRQGNRPITILAFIYASFAFPTSIWLAIARRDAASNHPKQPNGEIGRFEMDDQTSLADR